MLNLQAILKHLHLCQGESLAAICRPLQEELNISFFNFQNIDDAGHCYTITNRPDWMAHYYEQQFNQHTYFHQKPSHLTTNVFLRSQLPDKQEYIQARLQYRIQRGITLVQHFGNNCSFYHFAHNPESIDLSDDYYISIVPLLERFIYFFREQAHPLLLQVKKEKFIVPFANLPDKEIKFSDVDFLKKINTKRYFLSENHDIYLSKQEFSVMNLLITGNSIKQTSYLMNLSKHTVEKYLENIRLKLKCPSTENLRNYYKKLHIKKS